MSKRIKNAKRVFKKFKKKSERGDAVEFYTALEELTSEVEKMYGKKWKEVR